MTSKYIAVFISAFKTRSNVGDSQNSQKFKLKIYNLFDNICAEMKANSVSSKFSRWAAACCCYFSPAR